jgi:hypothetical protein
MHCPLTLRPPSDTTLGPWTLRRGCPWGTGIAPEMTVYCPWPPDQVSYCPPRVTVAQPSRVGACASSNGVAGACCAWPPAAPGRRGLGVHVLRAVRPVALATSRSYMTSALVDKRRQSTIAKTTDANSVRSHCRYHPAGRCVSRSPGASSVFPRYGLSHSRHSGRPSSKGGL